MPENTQTQPADRRDFVRSSFLIAIFSVLIVGFFILLHAIIARSESLMDIYTTDANEVGGPRRGSIVALLSLSLPARFTGIVIGSFARRLGRAYLIAATAIISIGLVLNVFMRDQIIAQSIHAPHMRQVEGLNEPLDFLLCYLKPGILCIVVAYVFLSWKNSKNEKKKPRF